MVVDPSTFPENPGWPLRNALAAWAFHRADRDGVRVLCWRQKFTAGRLEYGQSLVLDIGYVRPGGENCPKVMGWEKNEKGALGPRFVDMASSLNPEKLAENALNLNLQLMRWRLVPDLDLNKMQGLRCLLFGAGTLGCNVSRCLLGWGVKNITLIDNGRISYSNPVRQSLFRFEDSLEGGKPKATTAARALTDIVPTATVQGFNFTVPMPGHIISEKEEKEVQETTKQIEELVSSHDVIFMLMDTREGRWLPTMLSTYHSKLAFSVALGFDSYVVIRHGWRPPSAVARSLSDPETLPRPLESTNIPGDLLGCYFCSDVTAPGNSVRDRSLDQQCTVTRPGVSVIAAALAVETLSSLVQHPAGGLAAAVASTDPNQAFTDDAPSEDSSCLGCVPHQIRGYLSRFQQITPCVQRFNSCVACSERIAAEYRNRGWEFLRDVFNSPKTLEKITGLDTLQNATEGMEIWELSDAESTKSME